jgi:hypothetical protein
MRNIPILIICYARPEKTLKLIKDLSAQGGNLIYIAIDGPRTLSDYKKQRYLITRLQEDVTYKDLNINIWLRESNLGVGVAVITAIDWFFSKEKEGLILEDDLYISHNLLEYVGKLLPSLEVNSSVMMISCSNFFTQDLNHSFHFTNYPMIWGWATNREKWLQLREFLFLKKSLLKWNEFNSVYNYWRIGARRVLKGHIDTWDIPIAYEMRKRKLISIIPAVNLVSNLGADSQAVHTKNVEFPMEIPVEEYRNICDLDSKVTSIGDCEYNRMLEKRVFRIKSRHQLLPFYSSTLDIFRRVGNVNQPLIDRVRKVVIPD